MPSLSSPEFWRVRALIDSYGNDVAQMLSVTPRELSDAIYPGVDLEVLARLRDKLAGLDILPVPKMKKKRKIVAHRVGR